MQLREFLENDQILSLLQDRRTDIMAYRGGNMQAKGSNVIWFIGSSQENSRDERVIRLSGYQLLKPSTGQTDGIIIEVLNYIKRDVLWLVGSKDKGPACLLNSFRDRQRFFPPYSQKKVLRPHTLSAKLSLKSHALCDINIHFYSRYHNST